MLQLPHRGMPVRTDTAQTSPGTIGMPPQGAQPRACTARTGADLPQLPIQTTDIPAQ
ncbi:hypothetical protein ABCR94_00335 [Streptomyces sp. 21So2-11]|uniref:hypothetical protein n=1 Tax=Streptomyces sp. 21So2-11 TaxID=3144408 RepID=UPI00321C25AB